MENDEYTCKHFSPALPQGKDQANISSLLRHLAETLDNDLPNIEILDITFQNESDLNDGPSPSFTVYYVNEFSSKR